MQGWTHSGFNVFVGDPVEHTDADARRFLGRYLKKSSVTNARLAILEDGSVRLQKFTDTLVEEKIFAPFQFLAELQQHIPDKWEQTTRYFGCYSARTRGKAHKIQQKPVKLHSGNQ